MKRFLIIFLMVLLTMVFIVGCKGKAKLDAKPVITFDLVEMYYQNPSQPKEQPKFRDYGKLTFQVYKSDAKEAVDLFINAIKNGFYNSKVDGNNHTRFRYQFNEPDHMYFMRLKFTIKDDFTFSDIQRDTTKWGKKLSPASNINIKRGTICLSSELKSDLIIFKTKLAEPGKFIPIGQVTPDSIETLEKLFNAPTNIGDTQKTPQGTVVKSNPVNIFIFIDKITISE